MCNTSNVKTFDSRKYTSNTSVQEGARSLGRYLSISNYMLVWQFAVRSLYITIAWIKHIIVTGLTKTLKPLEINLEDIGENIGNLVKVINFVC